MFPSSTGVIIPCGDSTAQATSVSAETVEALERRHTHPGHMDSLVPRLWWGACLFPTMRPMALPRSSSLARLFGICVLGEIRLFRLRGRNQRSRHGSHPVCGHIRILCWRSRAKPVQVWCVWITPGDLEALVSNARRGRFFTEDDLGDGASPVVIVVRAEHGVENQSLRLVILVSPLDAL